MVKNNLIAPNIVNSQTYFNTFAKLIRLYKLTAI